MKTKAKFKKGDRCKIKENTSVHEFAIGEEVTVVKRMKNEGDPYYRCYNGEDYWYVNELDLEPIN